MIHPSVRRLISRLQTLRGAIFAGSLVFVFFLSQSNSHWNITGKNGNPSDNQMSRFSGGNTCLPTQSFYFLRIPKCGSTTLHNMIVRYVYKNSLVDIFPIKEQRYCGIGWPNKPTADVILQHPYGEKFDVFTEHSLYKKELLMRLLKPNAKYFTLIRYPYDNFISAYWHFHLDKYFQMKPNKFLADPERYEQNYTFTQGSISITKNFMSTHFGIKEEDSKNEAVIQHKMEQYDKEFALVLILEHLKESLVLLRRLFCWSYLDVIVIHLNKGTHEAKPEDSVFKQNHRKHSNADYMLYDHFNKTLWKKIAATEYFEEDLRRLNLVTDAVVAFCRTNPSPGSTKVLGKEVAGELLVIKEDLCEQMHLPEPGLQQRVARRQYPGLNVDPFVDP